MNIKYLKLYFLMGCQYEPLLQYDGKIVPYVMGVYTYNNETYSILYINGYEILLDNTLQKRQLLKKYIMNHSLCDIPNTIFKQIVGNASNLDKKFIQRRLRLEFLSRKPSLTQNIPGFTEEMVTCDIDDSILNKNILVRRVYVSQPELYKTLIQLKHKELVVFENKNVILLCKRQGDDKIQIVDLYIKPHQNAMNKEITDSVLQTFKNTCDCIRNENEKKNPVK